ncbi:MAG: AMP-binding protein [Deltaproteobacteria bacterium]|nr:AMP-binding protein [Deltaproteobacteria bacterium]
MTHQPNDTIVSIARQRAAKHPDRKYIIFLTDGEEQEEILTYGELDRTAKQVACWLSENGVNKGDRALTILPNSLAFNQVFFGCLYGGVLAVPLSEPAGPKQMRSYLETFVPTVKTAKPKILITTPILVEFLKNGLPDELVDLFAGIKIVTAEAVLNEEVTSKDLPLLQPADLAYLQFTSGSTGTPKGIMIAHCNVMANMAQAQVSCQWEEEKGTGLWLPLFHDFGLAAGMIGALYSGGFVVLMTPVHFIVKPVRWLNAISKYRCAYSYAPPFAFDICYQKVTAEEKEKLDLSCLISVTYGAEPVHYKGVKAFNETFAECGLSKTAIQPGFGMAETVIMFSKSSGLKTLCADRKLLETEGKLRLIDDASPDEEKKYLVSLGPSMIDHEILVRDDKYKVLPEGEVGKIMISGPSICEGYFENPDATKEVFQQQIVGREQPFLYTGDLGLMWEKDLYFTGRIKDLIIIRGRNYYPQDIEYALPQVEEIRPGCVIAFSSDKLASGESLVLAMEIKGNLLKDMEMFTNYILPAVDKKVVELVGQQFQIYPAERIYLQPGTIAKTSSGKIKHNANRLKFQDESFEGLLVRLPETPEPEEAAAANGIQAMVMRLFKEIVEQEPILDEPFLDLGGDSIKILEFLETLQEKYPRPGRDILDMVDETTTLLNIVSWLEDKE